MIVIGDGGHFPTEEDGVWTFYAQREIKLQKGMNQYHFNYRMLVETRMIYLPSSVERGIIGASGIWTPGEIWPHCVLYSMSRQTILPGYKLLKATIL